MTDTSRGDAGVPPAGGPGGLFEPGSVTWRVHAEPVMGIAALRALLLECLHPVAMTAFADYIVPAALEVMGVLSYSEGLAQAIRNGQLIDPDSPEEVEIRAHTIYAVALLTEEVNARRSASSRVIDPQIDARLWTHFHTTTWPHHLTRTTMY